MGGTLHEMEPLEGGGIMIATERFELPAGEEVRLAPLGSHVMLEDLVADLVPGETVELTLRFERASAVTFDVPIVPLDELAELEPAFP